MMVALVEQGHFRGACGASCLDEGGVWSFHGLVGGVFAAFEGVEAAEHVDAFAVVEGADSSGCCNTSL